ncbi:helix-turn-helix domain-containing protein [Lacticaseibacillus paracasei]|uniref:helix-turn-helix domain-containing protein n=1 Tax=Lacticaseibacillus paracasei TaxID=1597 RepID=UPI00235F55AF|nr:helix-turn-helix domain-containing protein [Lacticaseibacillus paracasei]
MGRIGSRYTLEETLFYIGMVNDYGFSTKAVEKIHGVNHNLVNRWLACYSDDSVHGLESKHTHQQYSQQFKQEIVQKYLAGNISYQQLACDFGIPDHSVIAAWVSLYTSGQSLQATGRAKLMKNGRKTTHLERIEIAQWTIANALNYVAATQQFNVSYGQVYAWVKKFKQGGEAALADRRGKAKQDNGRLTENERLKLENKRLQARLIHVSTEVAVLKKLQELERRHVDQTSNIKPFNSLRKK